MIEPVSAPPYGERTLAEVVPSVLDAAGVEGFTNALGIAPTDRACLVVVDGLGWELVRDHRAGAPFLSELFEGSRPISAVFPSTTAASLASLGTGLPPGEHGLVGYTFAVPGHARPMNALRWELYGIGEHVDLVDEFPPERIQRHPTLMQRAEAAGLPVTVVGPAEHDGTPLTRAILRGGRYVGAVDVPSLIRSASESMSPGERGVAYVYYPWLDTAAHLAGVGSDQWLDQLGTVDGIVHGIAAGLPAGTALFVTADHGIVDIGPEDQIDVADHPALAEGVRMLGGEARARHVYTRDGAVADVVEAWRAELGARAVVVQREEAIAARWFGPLVADDVRPRIGDVVAAFVGPGGVVQRAVDPMQVSFRGHHGSMTDAELRVPLFEFRA